MKKRDFPKRKRLKVKAIWVDDIAGWIGITYIQSQRRVWKSGGRGSEKLFGKINLPTQVVIGLTDMPNAPLPPIPPALYVRHIYSLCPIQKCCEMGLSSKRPTVGYSRLGQKLTFSSSFFGRIEDTKISFRDQLNFRKKCWGFYCSVHLSR